MNSSCSSTTNLDQGGGSSTITTIHPDIIQTHILTRLDGPTLASAACVSSQLHDLSTEDILWRDICSSTWPSVDDPLVSNIISSFPAGHRSFYNDSFPMLDYNQPFKGNPERSTPTTKLMSAVDIYYEDKRIFSRLQETETLSGWFLCSPFRVDLLDQKETVSTPVRQVGENDAWLKHLEDNLRLSWIIIDPSRKRAANISSGKPVSVQRHWLTGEVRVRFGSIMVGDGRRGSDTEFVDCGVVVTWGGKEAGELQVSEVSMLVEDMEGRNLNGRDSLAILQDAMVGGKRRRVRSEREVKVRYEEYVERKRERNGEKQRRERAMDMACIATGVAVFLSFWTFILFR